MGYLHGFHVFFTAVNLELQFPFIGPRKGKIKCSSLVYFTFCPDAAAMAFKEDFAGSIAGKNGNLWLAWQLDSLMRGRKPNLDRRDKKPSCVRIYTVSVKIS